MAVADTSKRRIARQENSTALFAGLGILSRKLRCGSFQRLFLSLQPRLPCPGTFEIIADLNAEPAQRLGLKLHEIPVLKWIQAAMIGSQRGDVAGLQRVGAR